MRIIVKTTIASESEIPWLLMKFREAQAFADMFIVSEFDRTLSGMEKPFVFDSYADEFSAEFDSLHYLRGKAIPEVFSDAETTEEHRHNERIFRELFASQLQLKDSDIIVSTDADEVLYRSTYEWIAANFGRSDRGYRFRLHECFYRPHYLWIDKEFVAPVALRYGAFKKTYPNQWRNQGPKLPGFWGVHFSWCMPVADMLTKVRSYGHAPEHRHLGTREVFEAARESRTFPFDNRDFQLENISVNSALLPRSLSSVRELIDPEVWGNPPGEEDSPTYSGNFSNQEDG